MKRSEVEKRTDDMVRHWQNEVADCKVQGVKIQGREVELRDAVGSEKTTQAIAVLKALKTEVPSNATYSLDAVIEMLYQHFVPTEAE